MYFTVFFHVLAALGVIRSFVSMLQSSSAFLKLTIKVYLKGSLFQKLCYVVDVTTTSSQGAVVDQTVDIAIRVLIHNLHFIIYSIVCDH